MLNAVSQYFSSARSKLLSLSITYTSPKMKATNLFQMMLFICLYLGKIFLLEKS